MKPEEFFEKLKTSGVPGVIEFVAADAGDPFIRVEPQEIPAVLAFLRDDEACLLDQLSLLSGVHYEDRFECVYHLLSISLRHDLVVKVHLDKDQPKVPTVSNIHPTANWHERETYDLVGIEFEGHPDPRRIYLPQDWEGHPLRKDYVFPKEYDGWPLEDLNDPEKQPEPEQQTEAAPETSDSGTQEE